MGRLGINQNLPESRVAKVLLVRKGIEGVALGNRGENGKRGRCRWSCQTNQVVLDTEGIAALSEVVVEWHGYQLTAEEGAS